MCKIKLKFKPVLVIGAMKAGSTSIYEMLAATNGVSVSTPKDTKFFLTEKQNGNWECGINWYLGKFCGGAKRLIEVSTSYSKFPDIAGVPERVKQIFPNAKFIYLIRDPVLRAISHYFHNVFYDRIEVGIDKALNDCDSKYYNYSNYSLQLKEYLKHFPIDSFCIEQFVDSECYHDSIKNILNFIFEDDNEYDANSKIVFSNHYKQGVSRHLFLETKHTNLNNEFAYKISKKVVKSETILDAAIICGISKFTLSRLVEILVRRHEKFCTIFDVPYILKTEEYEKYI